MACMMGEPCANHTLPLMCSCSQLMDVHSRDVQVKVHTRKMRSGQSPRLSMATEYHCCLLELVNCYVAGCWHYADHACYLCACMRACMLCPCMLALCMLTVGMCHSWCVYCLLHHQIRLPLWTASSAAREVQWA